jgi:hypothetical protein
MSRLSIAWNFFYLLIFYLVQLQISISAGFGPAFLAKEINQNNIFTIAYITIIAILVFDVLICFHKGFYAFGRGRVINDQKMIVKNYVTGQFILDFISIGLFLIPLFKS